MSSPKRAPILSMEEKKKKKQPGAVEAKGIGEEVRGGDRRSDLKGAALIDQQVAAAPSKDLSTLLFRFRPLRRVPLSPSPSPSLSFNE